MTVVVGADGSDASCRALRHAARSAAARGARLRVVMAYRPPEWMRARALGPADVEPTPSRPVPACAELEATRRMTEEVIAELRDGTGLPVDVEVVALPGDPADVLGEAARDADELVVGHRGHGAVASLLLGSVALACLLRATCPVTVVPDR
ncbi:universal stress protein [Actinomycetospora cinnamomea]|uniref:Nucleotide-binding universal stress UspA family protein n=1 Tax=Actinomycetospora cinnamomea TaxID=663609 RepID=A0A2U1F2J9_9PSEU|nr:universal stress protein [Actinomycetospora cinnamomea]PVZ06359.1 nucleotide-binding universal stress UspA family protein [Actinomycetospora cinnamomea]